MIPVSTPTQYSGYSEKVYDGYQRFSQYVPMRDGIKIAVDIYRPTKGGELHTEQLPVIFIATQYRRCRVIDGKLTDLKAASAMWYAPGIEDILMHGYIVAVMDVRGSGASFGQHVALQITLNDFYDIHDMIEWIAHRPFANGRVGMCGCSFLGSAQLMAISMAPPSLRCVVPNVAPMEYQFLNINGVIDKAWVAHLDETTYQMDCVYTAGPVDEDTDGSMLAAAIEEHKKAPSSLGERNGTKYFDSYAPTMNTKNYVETYFPNFLHTVNQSQVAVYVWGGWKDFFAADAFDWYMSLETPKKLTVGPWFHTGSLTSKDPVWAIEHLRWFDYWLKDIDNGIMDEPPIRLFNTNAPNEEMIEFYHRFKGKTKADFISLMEEPGEWRTYEQWPVPGMEYVDFYLNDRKANSVNSVNDGSLTTAKPKEDEAFDLYPIDYSVTKMGLMDRNYYAICNELDYTSFDEKSLTYTTPILSKDLNLTGFPVAQLWAKSPVKCLDFYVTLEDIDEQGRSFHLSEGKLRSAVRATMDPPYNHMGLPFHRNCERDQKDMPINEAVYLPITMFPMSHTLKAGHRLRVTLNNCDKENWDTPELDPAPTVTILRDREHPSSIRLPVVKK